MRTVQLKQIQTLLPCPDDGDVIKGSGGIRKIRWAAKRKGKRGGVRVIYYWRTAKDHIYLLNNYRKNEASDLTEKENEYLKKLVAGMVNKISN
jgi:hypothetical protein